MLELCSFCANEVELASFLLENETMLEKVMRVSPNRISTINYKNKISQRKTRTPFSQKKRS